MNLTNTRFGTHPLLVHAHGPHRNKPLWKPIKDAFYAEAPSNIGPIPGLTVVTCNNGHPLNGVLETSLRHLGIPCTIAGADRKEWLNSRDKPEALREALEKIETPYVLAADSRDCMVVADLTPAIERFERLQCDLVFGADLINWPPLAEFQNFEEGLPGAEGSPFKFLNGGCWIGRTEFCRTFFDRLIATAPVPQAPESEQGIIKQLLPEFVPRIRLDCMTELFVNIGYLEQPILEITTQPELRR